MLKWSEQYATGVRRIDYQHRMLFRMSNDFSAALDEGRGESVYSLFLDALDLYVQAHFKSEERCMDACRCPAAQVNKGAHARFTGVVARFQERHASVGFDRADARELTDTIEDWLVNHICRIDVQLRDWAKPEIEQ